MITISKELLEKSGYKCWKEIENPNNSDGVVRRWQKRFTDVIGIKYAIDINETMGWQPNNTNPALNNFWPSVQFYIDVAGKSQSINIELVQWFNESGQWSEITIEKMEEVVEDIWLRLKGEYYEKY